MRNSTVNSISVLFKLFVIKLVYSMKIKLDRTIIERTAL